MKFSGIMMLLSFCAISAMAQKISLYEQHASLVSILNKIGKQSGYDYIGSKQLLLNAKPVTIDVDQVSLKKALDICFLGQPMSYRLNDKLIVLQGLTLPPSKVLAAAPKKITPSELLVTYRGRVVNEYYKAMMGCSVKALYSTNAVRTDSTGRFSFKDLAGRSIAVTHVGYEPVLLEPGKQVQNLEIRMKPLIQKLAAVEVSAEDVNELPATYASGNVEVINSDQLQQQGSVSLPERLEAMGSGVASRLLDLTGYNGIENGILAQKDFLTSIDSETRNKLLNGMDYNISLEKGQPLVVIDGIPSFYTLDQIDPDQVVSLSILKSAPASAIWGFRAADGAILISTKRNRYNTSLNITTNGRIMVSGMPNVLYKKNEDMVESQDTPLLDGNSTATRQLTNHFSADSPVNDKWSQALPGTVPAENVLNNQQQKPGYPDYMLRKALQTHFDIGISGGTENFTHQFYAGYSHFLNNTKYASGQWGTLNYSLFSKSLQRLKWHGNVMYTTKTFRSRAGDLDVRVYQNETDGLLGRTPGGNDRDSVLNQSSNVQGVINTVGQRYNNQRFNIALGFNYAVLPWLSFNSDYTYNYGSVTRSIDSIQTAVVKRAVVNQSIMNSISLSKVWEEKHRFSAMLGVELMSNHVAAEGNATNNQLMWPADVIQSGQAAYTIKIGRKSNIRTLGVFSNLAYNYNRKYAFAINMRTDNLSERYASNTQAFPFYAVQGSWYINNEDFYHVKWLPKLNFKINYSHGSNSILGRKFDFDFTNTNLGRDAFRYGLMDWSPSVQTILGKMKMLSMSVNFGDRNGRISGSVEYIRKHITDLNSAALFGPFKRNGKTYISGLKEQALELRLNTLNMQKGRFSWMSRLLFNYSRRKAVELRKSAVDSLRPETLPGTSAGDPGALYAFKFKQNDARSSQGIMYFGSGIPVYYGTLMNTFSYGSVSLSVNLLYKLGYYFRKPTSDLLNYNLIFSSGAMQGDSANGILRQIGNEHPGEGLNPVYSYSDMNVLPADHIRLKDVNLSYGLQFHRGFLKKLRLYAEACDLGVIWTANKYDIDPDVNEFMRPSSYALGFSAGF